MYAVPLDDLGAGTSVRAMSSVTLTKCSKTDYEPIFRLATPCEGTKRYTYDPVSLESEFRLLPSSDGEPDLTAEGVAVGSPVDARCTTFVHHCSLSQLGEIELSESVLIENPGLNWLVYVVRASSPKASSCRPATAGNCEVLAVEAQKGSAMYGIRSSGELDQQDLPAPDTSANVDELQVLIEHGEKDDVRRVVYSVPLSSSGEIESLKGDQFEIEAKLAAREKLPAALSPLLSGYLVLADGPKAISGRYLASDSYTRTGNLGVNCAGTCKFEGWSVATSILDCDIKAGRRFVNLVADASRAAAEPGEKVTVIPRFGGLEITYHHEAAISDSNSPGRAAKAC